MKLLSLIVLVFCFQFNSFAQKKTKLPCIDKEFSLVVHIVKDSLGHANIAENQISSTISAVNQIFDSICISFKICEFKYVDNFRYDTISTGSPYSELLNQNHVPYRINVFYVDHILNPSKAAGFADLANICQAGNQNSLGGIVIKKSQGTTRVLAHEIGHYFGLLHTWHNSVNESIKSEELVDGSNADVKGDLINDTPADPFVKNTDPINYLSKNPKYPCKFIDKSQDANGDFYDPLVGNIMSYYPEYCDCGFTHEQYLKMAKTFLSNPKMW